MSDLPSGTVTFLLTDIAGSTSRWERNPVGMNAAIRQHDSIMERVVSDFDGWLVKSRGEGDSVFMVFDDAACAIGAALSIQRHIATDITLDDDPLRVRIAVHSGDAELRDGDYFGPTVNRGARLRAIANGGQTIVSGATAALAQGRLPEGATLYDLGMHRLRDLSQAEHVFELRHPDLPSEFPPLSSLDQNLYNFPVQAAPIVGRQNELAALKSLIEQAETRLITLTGPGGIGKTALATQVAADVAGEFPDGNYFVGLASLSRPDLVLSTIGQALGIRESGVRVLADQLDDFLRGKRLLLVIDNFEHVLPASVDVVSLLRASSGIKLLITSRSVLHVAGERLFSVPALQLPPENQMLTASELAAYESVRLFIERAQAVRAEFKLNDDNSESVKAICQRVGGLPLAIELAAARVRVLSPQAMLRRLTSVLPMLSSSAAPVPTRQQTLRSAIAWSYDLLGPSSKSFFRRLSVFAGGCSLEGVEAVIASEYSDTDTHEEAALDNTFDVLDALTSLVDASLLEQRESEDGEPRFSMLEIIREYGIQQLAEIGELDTYRQRHADYMLNLVEKVEPHLQGPDQKEWFALLRAEHANIRAALVWYRESGDSERYLRIPGAVFWYWFGHGYWTEALNWYDDALQRCPERTLWRAKALYGAGLVSRATGNVDEARKRFTESIEISREVGDRAMLARSMHLLSGTIASTDNVDEVRSLLLEALELARDEDDGWAIAVITRDLGGLASMTGDKDNARRYLEESIGIHRRRGEHWAQAHALNALGDLMRSRAMYDEAETAYHDSLHIFTELGTTDGRPSVLHNLAYVALSRGEVQKAALLFKEALGDFDRIGDARGVAECLAGFAGVLAAAGKPDEAARLLGAADNAFDESATRISASNIQDLNRNVELIQSALGPENYQRYRDSGRREPRDQIILDVLGISIEDFEAPEP